MSHELKDNVERRKLIVNSIPRFGLDATGMIKLIMSFGYNRRGARDKLDELKYLSLLKEDKGRFYDPENYDK